MRVWIVYLLGSGFGSGTGESRMQIQHTLADRSRVSHWHTNTWHMQFAHACVQVALRDGRWQRNAWWNDLPDWSHPLDMWLQTVWTAVCNVSSSVACRLPWLGFVLFCRWQNLRRIRYHRLVEWETVSIPFLPERHEEGIHLGRESEDEIAPTVDPHDSKCYIEPDLANKENWLEQIWTKVYLSLNRRSRSRIFESLIKHDVM